MEIKDFNIDFESLKDGKHQFVYEIDDEFFRFFEQSPVTKAAMTVGAELEKKPNLLMLTLDLKGNVVVECDRCLDDIDISINSRHKLYVKFSDEEIEEPEMIHIPEGTRRIKTAKYIYEYIILNIPIRNVHPDDEKGNPTCNPKMLRKLEELSKEEENKTDPRWNSLKTLLN
ncbi:MAG: hypothetical protein CSB01_00510 [Bacteroidia bacterium]|nr:MAG: hypothetical protein CSB01_00510 [Bacteroidia bacterium]